MARSCASDPLEKFRFGITWLDVTAAPGKIYVDGQEVADVNSLLITPKAGFHDVQVPKRTTNKIMYREGTDPDISSISAGLSTMEDIVLSRGLVPNFADAKDLAAWTALVHAAKAIAGYPQSDTSEATGAKSYRKEVVIWMYDRSGVKVRAWKLMDAFPVHYVPGSDLSSAEDGEKSMEAMTLAYEDFVELSVAAGVIDYNKPAVIA